MSRRGDLVVSSGLAAPTSFFAAHEHLRGGWSLAGVVCAVVGHRFVDLVDEAWNEIDPWAAVRRYSARVAICPRCGCERLRHFRGSGAEIWHPMGGLGTLDHPPRPAVPDIEIVALEGDW